MNIMEALHLIQNLNNSPWVMTGLAVLIFALGYVCGWTDWKRVQLLTPPRKKDEKINS
jgi:hypothetical protein